MNEYQSHNGGRPLYNDDIKNLQDLALAFSSLFMDCGLDFVISGCNVIEENDKLYIGEGYVWLDNKILKLNKTLMTGLSSPYSIIHVTKEPDEKIIYEDATTGNNCIMHYAEVRGDSQSVPEKVIRQNSDGSWPNLKTAFFGHYAILKDEVQTFTSKTIFNEVAATKMFLNPNGQAEIYVENGNKVVVAMKRNGSSRLYYKFSMTEAMFEVFDNDTRIFCFTGLEPLTKDDIEYVTGPDPDDEEAKFYAGVPIESSEIMQIVNGDDEDDE